MAPGVAVLGRWLLAALVLPCAEADSAWEHALSRGSVRGFPSYVEANKLLQEWVRRYPGSLRETRIGTSYQSRPIHAYILGRSAVTVRDTPQVLLTSLMHAREPASLTVLLYFLGRVLEQDSQGDPQAIYILENREIWLVPFVNPDGYVENQRLTRKSVRKNRRPTCHRSSDSGVDINRNFGVHWSRDFDACNEEFQGRAPFSEPETQALKKICDENNFRTALNFHSFGRMLTHPYNWARNPQLPADDQRIYSEVAKVFGWAKFGPAIKTVGYTAPGESDDWMYGERGIISMSPEVGPESGDFWPPPHEIPGINRRNFVRTMYVVQKAGLELGVEWVHRPASAQQLPGNATLAGGPPRGELELRLTNLGLSSSGGQALGVAVSGAAGPGPKAPAGGTGLNMLALPEAGGSVAAQLLPAAAGDGAGGRALSLRLPPIPRRGKSRLRLLPGRDWEPTGERLLRLCVAELRGPPPAGSAAAPRAVCHCSGAAELPAADSRGEASAAPPSRPVLVLAPAAAGSRAPSASSAAEADTALCKAAAAAGGPALPAWKPTARAPTGKSPGLRPGAKVVSAAGKPPSGAAPAVLDPAFDASETGEATAPLALFAFVATALGLGGCLAWQAIVGRRLRPLAATATSSRRPQAPPPLPTALEGQAARGPKVAPSGFDDDSGPAAGPKV